MKNIIFLIVLLIAVSTSCKKEAPVVPPASDKFIGTYQGDYTHDLSMGSMSFTASGKTRVVIEVLATDNEIIMDKGTNYEIRAKVDGSTLIINEQPFPVDFGDGVQTPTTLSGSGSLLAGRMLTLNLKMVGTYNGTPFVSTVIESLIKN